MVPLPSVENREKILKTLLAKEKVDNELDFKELANMTEGYTGSDLKVFTILYSLTFVHIGLGRNFRVTSVILVFFL